MKIIGPDKAIETIIFDGTPEDMEDKIVEENIEMIHVMIIVEAGIGQEKVHLQEIMVVIGIEVHVTVDQGQDLELVQIEIGIRCYNCREYDHFTRDCPISREERDLEQLQQMLNMEAEEQTHRQDSPTESHRSPLNLKMVGMAPPHSYL